MAKIQVPSKCMRPYHHCHIITTTTTIITLYHHHHHHHHHHHYHHHHHHYSIQASSPLSSSSLYSIITIIIIITLFQQHLPSISPSMLLMLSKLPHLLRNLCFEVGRYSSVVQVAFYHSNSIIQIHSFIHSFTHSFTHSLTHSFIHSTHLIVFFLPKTSFRECLIGW